MLGSEANPVELDSPPASGADEPPVLPSAAPAETGASRDVYKSSLGDEASIGPLLARAHLLRMRRQWDEAVAACTEALRRVPESATACSLLGDIYEAQGKLDVAMHWFGMAVELDPANKADRAKLDRVVGIQRRALLAEERAAQARVAAAGPSPHRTLQWFDRIFPPGKQETLARLILLIGGGLFLLLACTAAFVYFGGAASEGEARLVPPVPQVPVVVQPPDEPSPSPIRAAPPARGADVPPGTTTPLPSPAPAPLSPPAATSDESLRMAVARSVPADVLVTEAQADPRSSQVGLTIALPEAGGRSRERILRAAVQSLRAAALELPQMDRATIRVSLRGGNAGAPIAQPVFAGETATTALRALDPARAPEAELSALFTNPWWSPSLGPANSSP